MIPPTRKDTDSPGCLDRMAEHTTIPHPPKRIPILGDIIGIDRAKPNQKTLLMHERLGPIYRRTIMGTHLTFASGADVVADLNDETRFRKHVGRPLQQLRSLGGDGLFTAFNDTHAWTSAHNVLMPGFTKDAMRGYHDTMATTIAELVKHWDERPGQRLDVSAEMSKLTLEVIGRCGFGRSFGSFSRDAVDPFVTAMLRALDYSQRSSIPIPILGALLGRAEAKQNAADIAYLHSVVDEVIAARTGNPGAHADLLDLMLTNPDPETGQQLDLENVRDQVITFLIAGHETSSNALSFALHLLATHPDIAARARAEIDAMWPDASAPSLSFDQVPKLRYIRRVIDETLRLWPSAPGYFREAIADTTVAGGYGFKAGDWAFVLLLRLHRDPVWGPDPERFDPDRFLPENIKARPGHVYRPFGTGIRSCIGRQFALHEMVLALATIVHQYDLVADPDYTLEVDELLTLRPAGFTLEFRRR